MGLISWNGSLKLVIEPLDKQHENLVHIVNALHDAMLADMAFAVLGPIMVELVACTRAHFNYEEQLLRTYNHTLFGLHVAEHCRLTHQLAEVKAQFDAGKAVPNLEMMGVLRNWLSRHIKGSDKELVPYLKARHH